MREALFPTTMYELGLYLAISFFGGGGGVALIMFWKRILHMVVSISQLPNTFLTLSYIILSLS